MSIRTVCYTHTLYLTFSLDPSSRARKVVKRCRPTTRNTETRTGPRINQIIPERRDAIKSKSASHSIPVRLRIRRARRRLAIRRSTDRPSRLGDPDRLAARNVHRRLISVLEETASVADGVCLRVLEIGEGVHADEVGVLDHRGVGAVHPRRPGIDVSDQLACEPCAGNHVPRGLDERYDVGRVGAWVGLGCDAGGRVAVEVFAADGDGEHKICECRAVVCDCLAESRELVIDIWVEQPEEEGGICVDCGLDGADGRVGCSILDPTDLLAIFEGR